MLCSGRQLWLVVALCGLTASVRAQAVASAPQLAQAGVVAARKGDYGTAIAAYRRALKLDPDLAAARLNLALAFFKTGQIEAAARNFQRYLDRAPGDYRATLLLANCDLSLGRYADAVKLTTPLAAGHADDLALAYIRGTALIRSGQTQPGERWIDKIMARGDSPIVHLMLGDAYRQDQKLPQAIAEYQKAIAMAPKLPLAHLWLAEAQLRAGDSASALKNFQAEDALDPNNFETNFYLGYLLLQQSDLSRARPYLERAHKMFPSAFQPVFQLALLDERQGQLPQARQLLEQALAQDPGEVQGHVVLGQLYYRLHLPKLGDAQRALVRQLMAHNTAPQRSAAQ